MVPEIRMERNESRRDEDGRSYRPQNEGLLGFRSLWEGLSSVLEAFAGEA